MSTGKNTKTDVSGNNIYILFYRFEFFIDVNNWNRILMANASDRFHYVVDCYYHAITAKFPRLRYRCGKQ